MFEIGEYIVYGVKVRGLRILPTLTFRQVIKTCIMFARAGDGSVEGSAHRRTISEDYDACAICGRKRIS